MKQLGLGIVEKMGIVEPGTTAKYTQEINEESALYARMPVGQSGAGKAAEIVTDIGLALAIPLRNAANGAKLVAQSAIGGALDGAGPQLAVKPKPSVPPEPAAFKSGETVQPNKGVFFSKEAPSVSTHRPPGTGAPNAGPQWVGKPRIVKERAAAIDAAQSKRTSFNEIETPNPIINKEVTSTIDASKQTPGNSPKSNIQRVINIIEEYLGKDFKMIKNDHGDAVFINKDNTKKIRFDVFDSHGELPHGHVQYRDGKRWRDYTEVHRIELKGLLELIESSRPKFER